LPPAREQRCRVMEIISYYCFNNLQNTEWLRFQPRF